MITKMIVTSMISSILLHAIHGTVGNSLGTLKTATYDSWISQLFYVAIVKFGFTIFGILANFGKLVWFPLFCWEHKLIVATGKGRLNRVNVRLILWIANFYLVWVSINENALIIELK